MENLEARLRIMENSLVEVQNSIDLSLGKIFNELKEDPKKVAQKVAKISLDSFEALQKLFPTEANRMVAWWRLVKVKLIKWGVPSALLFAGYLLNLFFM